MNGSRFVPRLSAAALAVSLLAGCGSFLSRSASTSPAASSGNGSANASVDDHNFSPVDKWLARASPVLDDAEGSLNPYVLKVIDAYPIDGSYPYRCTKEPEYSIYNGVTENLWYQGRVVAKGHPNATHCSYCCGFSFEVLIRAMKLRNKQKGLDPDDFHGMTFNDLFNLLQIWYIEGAGDSPQKGIEYYGLGKAIDNWEDAKPGDFGDISRDNKTGHSIVFLSWVRDPEGKIIGMNYFSSQGGGVAPKTEFFNDSGGKMMRKWVRLARVGSIENYRPFDRANIPQREAYAP